MRWAPAWALAWAPAWAWAGPLLPLGASGAGALAAWARAALHCGCVVLVAPPRMRGLQAEAELQALWRNVGERGAISSVEYFQTFNETVQVEHCRGQPLFLLILTKSSSISAAQNLLQEASGRARWLVLAGAALGAWSDAQLVGGAPAPFHAQLLLAREHSALAGAAAGALLSEAFRVGGAGAGALRVVPWGRWPALPPPAPLARRRRDLHGLRLRAAVVHDPPVVTVEMDKTGVVTEVGGFFPIIWSYLSEVLNFTSEWHVPPDGAYGSMQRDGEWNGMIRMQLDGRVDVAVCPFMMTPLRAEVVSYTAPLATTRASLFIRTPSEGPVKWEVFMQPFHRSLWLALAPAPALLAALLWAAHLPAPAPAFSAGDCALCLWGAFCAQGHSASPGPLSARIVFLTSFLTAMVLLAGYTANFMAYLTAPRFPLPFTDLEGLLQDRSYSFAVLAKSGLYTNFQSAQDEVMQRVFELHLKPRADSLPLIAETAVAQMCAHAQAYMGNEDITRGLATCPLTVLRGSSFSIYNAIVLQKRSPYAFLFNDVIQTLRRSGVLRLQYRKMWSAAAPAEAEAFSRVRLGDVMPLLWLLGAGAGLALLAGAVELLAQRRLRTPPPAPARGLTGVSTRDRLNSWPAGALVLGGRGGGAEQRGSEVLHRGRLRRVPDATPPPPPVVRLGWLP